MWDFESEFSQIIQRAPQIKTFRIPSRAENVDYLPGQYFFVNIMIDGQDAEHHFTISSSPTEKGYLEFTKRITDHEFSQALARTKPGDWVHVSGPQGSFTLPDKMEKLAFLSGGIGITPLRSMLRCVADRREPRDIIMLYGNATFEDIVFREELDAISNSSPGIKIVHVLANPPADWKGKTGLISKDLVVEVIPDYRERTYYVSGPPRMVVNLEEQLSALNIPPEQLKRDSFTGYD